MELLITMIFIAVVSLFSIFAFIVANEKDDE